MFKSMQMGWLLLFFMFHATVRPLFGAKIALEKGEALLPHPQVLRISLLEPIACLDPSRVDSVYDAWVVRDLFEGLLIRDEAGKAIPGVAYAWEHKNHQVWTFYLRKSAKWSNNDPVTAHDFVLGFCRLVTEGGASAQELKTKLHLKNAELVLNNKMPVDQLGIEALDDHTLRLTLERPVFSLLELLTSVNLMPTYQHSAEQVDYKEGKTPWALSISNGAYCAPVLYPNEKVRVSRNNFYWNNKNTTISCVDYFFSKDPLTRYMHFDAGSMDITPSPADKSTYAELKQKYPNQLRLFPTLAWKGLLLNTKKPPFNQSGLRKALNLTLDRKKLLEEVYGDKAAADEVCYGLLSKASIQESEFLLPEWHAWPYEQRVKEAKRLLEETFSGKELPIINFSYTQCEDNARIAAILAHTWKATLGLTVLTHPKSFDVIISGLDSSNYEMSVLGFGIENNSPLSVLALLSPEGGQNYPRYRSEAYTKLVERASKSSSIKEIESLCSKANLTLIEDSPCLSLCYSSGAFLIRDYVRGFHPLNNTGYFYAKDLYMVEHPASPQNLFSWSDTPPWCDIGRPQIAEEGK